MKITGYAVMSDIHGNLQALESVSEDLLLFDIRGILLLGDLIDYGMQSNETVAFLRENITDRYTVFCNIRGNHERAVLDEFFEGFSSARGQESARFTASVLNEKSRGYLQDALTPEGQTVFELDGKKCLAIHGSLQDPYWKAIAPGQLGGDYRDYDMVLSGHSHLPHFFANYYETQDALYRNRKKTVFLNPGSVGQPRNHDPRANYAIWEPETGECLMRSVSYDVEKAMSHFHGQVDDFYRSRLQIGI